VRNAQGEAEIPGSDIFLAHQQLRALVTIARLDSRAAVEHLNAPPSLATAKVARSDEFFLAERLAQDHEGDTALHAADSLMTPRWREN
jgi:hypothetical protein